MVSTSDTGNKIRLSADLTIYGGILLALLDVLALVLTSERTDRPPILVMRFLPAAAGLLLAIVISALLRAVAAVVDRLPPKGQALTDLIDRVDLSLNQIRMSIEQLPGELEQTLGDAKAESTRATRAAQSAALEHAIPSDHHSSDGAIHGSDVSAKALERVVFLLEEIRELTMLDDAGRTVRLQQFHERRKTLVLAEARRHIHRREWALADQNLAALEAERPGSPDLAAVRDELEAGRRAAEHESIERVKAKVEDLMAISSWDQAFATAQHFAENFPQNHEGQNLLDRVTRERDLFKESTVHRLYEEIKDDIERRHWRRALSGAQRLLERFSDHRKTDKIRSQLRTIQDNAEIEERQESEATIQELLRSKRFAEAIELAEEMLDRFPNSPQAESLNQLLPKMRELAIQHEAEA